MILFLKFKQKGSVLFLDQDIEVRAEAKQKYHIVISPSLYWVKKVTLPLKYIHEIKKIAATLFEELLPPGKYSFYVAKDGNDFIIFAYEDVKILALLTAKGIHSHQIIDISFAQFVFKDITKAIVIDEKNVIWKKDGIVILLPATWFKDTQPLNTDSITMSKHTIQLEQFSHIVDRKTLYKIIMLLTFFIFVLLGEYFYFVKQKEVLALQKEQLFKEYDLKPTLMQNKAILAHYKKEDEKEQKLRKYISYFLKANFQKGEKIVSISFEKPYLKVSIEGVKKENLKRLLTRFMQEKIAFKTKQKGKNLLVEVKI